MLVFQEKMKSETYVEYKKNKNIKNFKFHKINLNKKRFKKLVLIIKRKYKIYCKLCSTRYCWKLGQPEDWYQTNVVSNSILIKHLLELKIKKYINFGTPEVYGNTPS